jgi:hypothetical protein
MPGRQRTIRRPAAAADDVSVLRRRLAEADARAEESEAACAATRHELDVLREQSRQHTQQLLEAQVALEESHDRYVSLYDFAPVAFVVLNIVENLVPVLRLTKLRRSSVNVYVVVASSA